MQNIVLLKKYALNYLGKYDSSKNNLKRILKNKIKRLHLDKKEKFMLYDSVNNIIKELENQNLIDDKKYIYSKIRNASTFGKSKNFIISYLLNKGLEKEDVNDVINNFEIDFPNWQEKSIDIFIRKKRIILENEKNKEKNIAKLARAGFDYNIIKKKLRI